MTPHYTAWLQVNNNYRNFNYTELKRLNTDVKMLLYKIDSIQYETLAAFHNQLHSGNTCAGLMAK